MLFSIFYYPVKSYIFLEQHAYNCNVVIIYCRKLFTAHLSYRFHIAKKYILLSQIWFGQYEKVVQHGIYLPSTRRALVKGKSRAKGEPWDQSTAEGRHASIISRRQTPFHTISVLTQTKLYIKKNPNRRKPHMADK